MTSNKALLGLFYSQSEGLCFWVIGHLPAEVVADEVKRFKSIALFTHTFALLTSRSPREIHSRHLTQAGKHKDMWVLYVAASSKPEGAATLPLKEGNVPWTMEEWLSS